MIYDNTNMCAALFNRTHLSVGVKPQNNARNWEQHTFFLQILSKRQTRKAKYFMLKLLFNSSALDSKCVNYY